MTKSELLYRVLAHFRRRRMRVFEKRFGVTSETRILDVGGSPFMWSFVSVRPRVTLLNLPSALPASSESLQVAGDGRMLPFRDRSFDIVFSNSVIEHVGDNDDQRSFAEEVRRVGNGYWVQTPDRKAPFEMHVMLPFVHLLPKRLQRFVVHRFTVWQFLTEPSAEEQRVYLNHFLHELRLLDRNGMRLLFPDSDIVRERVLGFPKSLIAIRCSAAKREPVASASL